MKVTRIEVKNLVHKLVRRKEQVARTRMGTQRW